MIQALALIIALSIGQPHPDLHEHLRERNEQRKLLEVAQRFIAGEITYQQMQKQCEQVRQWYWRP